MERDFQIRFSKEEIAGAAQQFWRWADGARVLSLSGGLGAGKTTFIHALCKLWGVQDAVSSPTFALINEYRYSAGQGPERIVLHMDWYRLQSLEEAIDAGMEDALAREDACCLVEWPERAPGLLRMPHIAVQLAVEEEGRRLLHAVRRP